MSESTEMTDRREMVGYQNYNPLSVVPIVPRKFRFQYSPNDNLTCFLKIHYIIRYSLNSVFQITFSYNKEFESTMMIVLFI